MTTSMKRPASIWLTQFLIAVVILIFSFTLLRGLTFHPRVPVMRYLLGILFLLVLLSILISAFWGLIKKTFWGKWLGVISLIIIWAILTYSQLFPSTGPYQQLLITMTLSGLEH